MVYGHSVGYTVGTRFNLPHGVSCGIPLPYIISNYALACAPKMRRIAEAYGVDGGGEPVALGVAIGEKASRLVSKLRLPPTLKGLGAKESELPTLADGCSQRHPR